MKTYIIVTALGLCLAIPGYAQKTKPPRKGKQPSAAERSKAADQRAGAQKRAAQKRAIQKAAAQKPGGKAPAPAAGGRPPRGKAPAAGGRPPRGKAPAPAAGGRPPRGKAPAPAAGGRPPRGKAPAPAAGRGPKPPQTAATRPNIMQRRTKLFAHLFKPNKKGELITIKSITAKLSRLDKNKDGRLSPEEMPAITFP